jgi:hypothetical protein
MRAVFRFEDLKDIGIPWSRKTVYTKIGAGQFPPPISLGRNTSVWVADEIYDWIKGCIAERDNPATVASREAKSAHARRANAASIEAQREAKRRRKLEAAELARMAAEAKPKRRKRIAETASANNEVTT